MPPSALADLSYDLGLRALALQEQGVEQLRVRTGTLLAVASLTASFFGAETLQRTRGINALDVLALLALVVSVVGCVYLLLPKRGFVFSLSAPGVYEALFAEIGDDEEVKRHLIYWLEGYWIANQRKIDILTRFFAAAAVALAAQLLLWACALAATV